MSVSYPPPVPAPAPPPKSRSASWPYGSSFAVFDMGMIGSAPGAAKEPAGREGIAGGTPLPAPVASGTVLLPLGTGERLNEDAAKPLAEMRCRLDEAFRAGESGRYRARAVRMKVYERSAGFRQRCTN